MLLEPANGYLDCAESRMSLSPLFLPVLLILSLRRLLVAYFKFMAATFNLKLKKLTSISSYTHNCPPLMTYLTFVQ